MSDADESKIASILMNNYISSQASCDHISYSNTAASAKIQPPNTNSQPAPQLGWIRLVDDDIEEGSVTDPCVLFLCIYTSSQWASYQSRLGPLRTIRPSIFKGTQHFQQQLGHDHSGSPPSRASVFRRILFANQLCSFRFLPLSTRLYTLEPVAPKSVWR